MTTGIDRALRECIAAYSHGTAVAIRFSGELRIAAAANDAGALREEMKDFKRKITEAGRTTYAARVGAHDDLVLSVATTLWLATQGPVTAIAPFRLV